MGVRFSAGAPRIDCQLLKYRVSTIRVSPSQRPIESPIHFLCAFAAGLCWSAILIMRVSCDISVVMLTYPGDCENCRWLL